MKGAVILVHLSNLSVYIAQTLPSSFLRLPPAVVELSLREDL